MTAIQSSTRRKLLQATAAGIAAPWTLSHAAGQIAGGKTITLVVSYAAGGGADLMARLIAPKLAEALGQTVVVDTKPGASGQIAASQVARATPDGTQLLLDCLIVCGQPGAVSQAAVRHRQGLYAAGGAGAVPECAGLHARL